jgi:hypothetical protein
MRIEDVYIHVFLTSALVRGGWSASRPGKIRISIGQEAGWVPEPVWTLWRRETAYTYSDSNYDPSVVQPVASRYTDCATAAALSHHNTVYK